MVVCRMAGYWMRGLGLFTMTGYETLALKDPVKAFCLFILPWSVTFCCFLPSASVLDHSSCGGKWKLMFAVILLFVQVSVLFCLWEQQKEPCYVVHTWCFQYESMNNMKILPNIKYLPLPHISANTSSHLQRWGTWAGGRPVLFWRWVCFHIRQGVSSC